MSIRVFSADSNPAVDPFSFRVSDNQGAYMLAHRQAYHVVCPDGRPALQKFRTQQYETDMRNVVVGGTFDEAWKIAPSGGMPVWQMRT